MPLVSVNSITEYAVQSDYMQGSQKKRLCPSIVGSPVMFMVVRCIIGEQHRVYSDWESHAGIRTSRLF